MGTFLLRRSIRAPRPLCTIPIFSPSPRSLRLRLESRLSKNLLRYARAIRGPSVRVFLPPSLRALLLQCLRRTRREHIITPLWALPTVLETRSCPRSRWFRRNSRFLPWLRSTRQATSRSFHPQSIYILGYPLPSARRGRSCALLSAGCTSSNSKCSRRHAFRGLE